jgi:hypothetical protein
MSFDKKVYIKAKTMYGPATALKIAMNSNKKIIGKSAKCAKAYEIKAKSLSAEARNYYADFVFADTRVDLDGDTIPTNDLLTQINGMKGDLEHVNNINKDLPLDTQPLFEVVDAFFDGEHEVGKVKFNINHEQFETVWDYVKKGDFGISKEYIMDGDSYKVIGITGAKNPRNPRAKVIATYEGD